MINTRFPGIFFRSTLSMLLLGGLINAAEPPTVTIIFVVDQLAYHYFPHLAPYFKHGFKLLLQNGINYTNALHPHGMPSTSTGHTGLSTGTWAWYHGIIGNRWRNTQGEIVNSDDDAMSAAVFSPSGTYNYGKSAHMVMVDSISDQFARAHTNDSPHYAYGVSLKSRAATLTATKLGKAIWFEDNGQFTSSKAYFNQLPAWLVTFNKKLEEQSSAKFSWQPVYPLTSPAYATVVRQGYRWSEPKNSLIGRTFSFNDIGIKKGKKTFQQFMLLPHANQLLLDLTKTIMSQHTKNENLLIWVCLSTLDKLGHAYGPQSYETVDMLYHLDRQLGSFMNEVMRCYGKEQTLFALTADHGISPIVEVVHMQGYKPARRINAKMIKGELNKAIKKKFGIQELISGYKTPQFYLDQKQFKTLKKSEQTIILQFIKHKLMHVPGIKQVWTFDELRNTYYEPYVLENFFKQQLFPGRSGQIIVQTFPFVQLTEWPSGTNHQTPYWYDVHVPLILYQPGLLERKTITQKVFTLQFANTLADILHVERPSASTFDPLPGINYSQFTSIDDQNKKIENKILEK